MAKKTLLLHIGYPKCGSTSIQNFLFKNKDELISRGYGLLDQEMAFFSKNSTDQPPVNFLKNLRESDLASEKLTKNFESLSIQADKKNIHTIILSAENLSDARFPELFRPISELFTIKVVLYFRRHDDWFLAAWKQWFVKSGQSLKDYFMKYTKNKKLHIKNVLKKWIDLVGIENTSVNILKPEALHKGDLLEDFCHKSGIDFDGLERVSNANKSINYSLLECLSQTPFIFDGPHDNTLFELIENLPDAEQYGPKGSPLTIPQRQKIIDCHQEENEWLAEKFFQGQSFDNWMHPSQKPYTPLDEKEGQRLLNGLLLMKLLDK
ncbi:hypothetical protein QGN29_02175 [Temperatibacter marinus]|uniref:Sulfotransferase domain-containing protein n=1 Tax=Temperatibacter marinus TaxID=1456591 RepID=A0AA52HB13_9PROT|nr:hypothetical protein [Temperatibacter marinus]WND03173.1 hypothetical protein QGN29_02175 [Temperatibacter marinus]